MTRTCKNCKKEFEEKDKKHKSNYCSTECRIQYARENNTIIPQRRYGFNQDNRCVLCGKNIPEGSLCKKCNKIPTFFKDLPIFNG